MWVEFVTPNWALLTYIKAEYTFCQINYSSENEYQMIQTISNGHHGKFENL